MKTSSRFIILIISTICHFTPIHPLRIRTSESNETRVGGLTASPTLIYRRRLSGGRFKESIYPHTSPRSQVIDEEQKTDLYPIVSQPITNGYTDETVEPNPYYSSTTTPNRIRKLRRNRARLRSTNPQEALGQEYAVKTHKVKSGRRRKVKRPVKIKPIPQKLSEEEVSSVDEKKTNGTEGDKNLALEIGSEDGKYALIDKFFESKPSQAPGVISYSPSEDFAGDNKYTLGNVKENDIWLSEGHLLVLKGGDLDASLREHWKPIDNYHRGKRPPLKIALDSDNPPPFPVFVNDSGPPVFLGPPPPFGLPYPPQGAINETFDPSRLPPPGLIPLYPNGTIPHFFGPPPPGFGGGNNSLPFFPGPPPGNYGNGYGQGGFQNGSFPPPFPPFPPGGFNRNNTLPPPPFFPFPPPGNRNGSFPPPFFPPPGFNPNISNGPPPGGYPFLPPLALNPNDNETDDPSIFLPPPYDFDYQDDNSTLVPPGPFAPGLVVPPPKDFYTVYNKTQHRPTFPPATGLSYFGKRPQRPNGKKPKFPITNPPDDSEEAYQPLVTTPYPYHSESPYKKRKQRPGKANKDIFGSKYESETDNGKVSIVQPVVPVPQQLPEQVISQRPITSIPVLHNTITPLISTTPKPLNNFVYVRGQLKSLAELNSPPQQEQYEYDPTPRPPFDERGYPTRVLEEPDTVPILQYQKTKTTAVPAKSFYYNTPKYDAIYNTNPPKKSKQNLRQQIINYALNQQQRPVIQPSQPPIGRPETQSIFINHNNNNQLSNQGQNLYGPNFQEKITPVQPPYYTNSDGLPQDRPQIIELQSPKAFNVASQRQPHSYNHANVQQNLNYQPNAAFRPAFGPNESNQQQQPPQRSKLFFPGQVTQSGPIFNFRTPLYQQERRPQIQGYYSPVTQYYQPLGPNPQQQPQQDNNNFYQSPISGNQNQRYFGSRISNRQPNQQQNGQAYYSNNNNNGQGQTSGNNQVLPNAYNSHLNQFNPQSQQAPIRQQDVYVNYREPLPQYNTESEAVTTRTIFKAGPSQAPLTAAGSGSSDVTPKPVSGGVANDGSYYSFERGGPGGFSYKIRL